MVRQAVLRQGARYGPASRLSGQRAYEAVFAGRRRQNLGPLTLWLKANALGHHRLGLSVSRRVGMAVVRNRLKRRLREAFRLGHRAWPGAYDLVVVVHPHAGLKPAEYGELLGNAVREAHRRDQRRTGAG